MKIYKNNGEEVEIIVPNMWYDKLEEEIEGELKEQEPSALTIIDMVLDHIDYYTDVFIHEKGY